MESKLTTMSQAALSDAIQSAAAAGNPQVEPVHLLSALLGQEGGIAVGLLDAVGVDRQDLGRQVRAALVALPSASGGSVNEPVASKSLSRVLELAKQEAAKLGDEYISTEHLLLGIAGDGSPAAGLLTRAGATRDALAEALPAVRGSGNV
ncbi:MAG: Clp protease N-terminal domain-containing protein, partial [Cellulomonadaceae bacterium]